MLLKISTRKEGEFHLLDPLKKQKNHEGRIDEAGHENRPRISLFKDLCRPVMIIGDPDGKEYACYPILATLEAEPAKIWLTHIHIRNIQEDLKKQTELGKTKAGTKINLKLAVHGIEAFPGQRGQRLTWDIG